MRKMTNKLSFLGDSGRLPIVLAVGVTTLSLVVMVASVYLFASAGRTKLPGPLSFRIFAPPAAPAAVNAPPSAAIPIPATVEIVPVTGLIAGGQALAQAPVTGGEPASVPAPTAAAAPAPSPPPAVEAPGVQTFNETPSQESGEQRERVYAPKKKERQERHKEKDRSDKRRSRG